MFPLRPQLRTLRTFHKSLRKFSTYIPPENLQYPESSSQNHYDLASYVDYVSQMEVDLTSPVYKGTHYEYTVQSSLERLGMSLRRIGGASDCGIDLLGTWSLPSTPQPLKVLIQCKAVYQGPAQARELEGAFVGAPQGWRGSGVLALLVSQKIATKGMREALGRSRWPMGYVFCKPDGNVQQMLWNKAAELEGLGGIDVGVKYGGGDISEKEVVLTWKGKPIGK